MEVLGSDTRAAVYWRTGADPGGRYCSKTGHCILDRDQEGNDIYRGIAGVGVLQGRHSGQGIGSVSSAGIGTCAGIEAYARNDHDGGAPGNALATGTELYSYRVAVFC